MFPKCSPQLSYAILILTEALLLSVPISSDTNPYQAPYPCFSFLFNKQLIGAWAHFGKFIRKRKATWEKVVGFFFCFLFFNTSRSGVLLLLLLKTDYWRIAWCAHEWDCAQTCSAPGYWGIVLCAQEPVCAQTHTALGVESDSKVLFDSLYLLTKQLQSREMFGFEIREVYGHVKVSCPLAPFL